MVNVSVSLGSGSFTVTWKGRTGVVSSVVAGESEELSVGGSLMDFTKTVLSPLFAAAPPASSTTVSVTLKLSLLPTGRRLGFGTNGTARSVVAALVGVLVMLTMLVELPL